MPASRGVLCNRVARAWFGATALLGFGGLFMAAWLGYRDQNGFFQTGWRNALNEFAYFTEQSHVIVAVTCLLLAANLDRDSTAFRTARLTGVVAIIVTGVVYHVLLGGEVRHSTWSKIENADLHTVVPIAATLGFLIFGPRGLIAPRVIGFTLIFLVSWAIFTTIRGAISGWWPYAFVDIDAKGYPRVLVNALALALMYLAIGFLCLGTDRAISSRHR